MEDTFSVVGEDLAEKGTFGQRPEVREGDAWGGGGVLGEGRVNPLSAGHCTSTADWAPITAADRNLGLRL